MPMDIIVLLDGTWNKPQSLTDNSLTGAAPTNVYRTWLGLGGRELNNADVLQDVDEVPGKKLIYIRGVGTEGDWLDRKIAGATGLGVAHRIRTAYRLLSEVYRNGDRLFIFGFSRGALTARSLSAMLQGGLKAKMTNTDIESAFDTYRYGKTSSEESVQIEYLGLWDTVAAISLPQSMTRFHLVRPTNIKRVRHALALDEVRKEFAPVLWSADRQIPGVTEAWFCGAHANIGGGYKDAGLSNIALFWLLEGAKRSGLDINLYKVVGFHDEQVARGVDSWSQFWGQLPIIGHAIREMGARKAVRHIPAHHYIHASALDAFDKVTDYRPAAVDHTGDNLCKEKVKDRTIQWGINDDGSLEEYPPQ